MATDNQLAIRLEARIRDFERNMAKANKTAGREFGGIEHSAQKSATRVQAIMGGMVKNFGAGLFAGIAAGGVAGIVNQIGQVSKAIAMVGDEAKRAGVSAQVFQEWKFVAEQNRIGVDAMVDGLKELNLRADEFIQTGSGSGAEAFQRLGYGATELADKLKNPSGLMLEIIDRLGKMDKAAQIRIADEIFGGTGGERFVELVDQGEAGIRATIERARELGIVMEDDVIERAAELDRKFNEITTTVSAGLKTAIVEAAGALQNFINSFEGMWQRYEQRRKTAELGAAVGSVPGGGTIPGADGGPATVTTPKTDRLPKAEWVPPTPPPGGFGSTKPGGGSRDAAASAAQREAERVRELIGELQRELSLVGATDLERQTSNMLREAGAAATADQKAQIVALVTSLHDEEAAHRAATQAIEDRGHAIESAFEMGADAIGSIIDRSVSAEDAVRKLAAQLALAAAQAALFGSGPLAGLFGKGFLAPKIPGYANGTNFHPGGMAIVGEKGPELLNLPRGSQVIPDARMVAVPQAPAINAPSAGARISIDARTTIHAPNADKEGLARLEALVKRQNAELPSRVVATVRQAQKTRQLR